LRNSNPGSLNMQLLTSAPYRCTRQWRGAWERLTGGVTPMAVATKRLKLKEIGTPASANGHTEAPIEHARKRGVATPFVKQSARCPSGKPIMLYGTGRCQPRIVLTQMITSTANRPYASDGSEQLLCSGQSAQPIRSFSSSRNEYGGTSKFSGAGPLRIRPDVS